MNAGLRSFQLMRHGAWFAAVCAVIYILLVAAPASWAGGVIAADEAYDRARAGELLIVDVRSPGEWHETGLPAGAAAVTIHDRRGPTGFLEEMLAAVDGNRETPIAMICAVGGRSSRAQRFLEANGFTNVLNVEEGMLGRGEAPGWLERGLPVEAYTR